MSIFTKWIGKSDRKAQADAVMRTLEKSTDDNVKEIYERLKVYREKPGMAVMRPFYLYTACMEAMIGNIKEFKSRDYAKALEYAEEVYKTVFPYEENTEDFEELFLIFLEFFDENSAIARRIFNPVFYNLYNNKQNYVKWLRATAKFSAIGGNEVFYVPYAIKARMFYYDEEQFAANVLEVCLRMFKSSNAKLVYEEEVARLEHLAGIYNVDEARIISVEQRLDTAETMLQRATEILKVAEQRLKTIDTVTATSCQSVKEICDTEITLAQARLSEIASAMQRDYDSFVEGQKQLVLYEKQQLVEDTFAAAEKKLAELQRLAQLAVNSANMELMKLKSDSGEVMSKVRSFLADDEKLKSLLETVNSNSELIDKMERLVVLGDSNLDVLEQKLRESVAAEAPKPAEPAQKAAEAPVVVKTVPAEKTVVVPEEAHGYVDHHEDETFADINFFLNETVPFRSRWEKLQERKAEMAANGEWFHEKFDDILTAVIENSNPYLIGPSGCGKTYLVNQIAKLLGVEFIDIGYINEEYDILGFQTANGGYSTPNFYRCYKFGKIAFCDELDNGNSRATVKLNSFLSNTEDACYNFPNGESVMRHPNFRIIGAGNTAGNGADSNYNTREKIEESVQQRFMPIYVGYDNRVEQEILKDYEDWFEFVVRFRAATDAWSKNSYGDAAGIITTRDVAKIRKYLDNGSFDMDRILQYQFIQTKDNSYLAFLADHIEKNTDKDAKCRKIVRTFANMVAMKRKAEAY